MVHNSNMESRCYNKNKKVNKKNQGISIHDCYTCNPKGKVRSHIIQKTNLMTFHYDMLNRPILIATPNRHVHTIFDLKPEEQDEMWHDIRQFLHDHDYKDYQVFFNNGEWQSHYHFHIKIRANEEQIERDRKCHLSKRW